MTITTINHLPIEYITFEYTLPLYALIIGICIQISLQVFFNLDTRIYSFFLGTDSKSDQKKKQSVHHERKIQDSAAKPAKKDGISKGDVEVVFRSLGMLQEREEVEAFDSKNVFDMFEDKEATEQELKAAFDVFDENKDGFIDARELQRLLCSLGLKEGSEMENCRRMIVAVDENGDDKIELSEFVTFMNKIVSS